MYSALQTDGHHHHHQQQQQQQHHHHHYHNHRHHHYCSQGCRHTSAQSQLMGRKASEQIKTKKHYPTGQVTILPSMMISLKLPTFDHQRRNQSCVTAVLRRSGFDFTKPKEMRQMVKWKNSFHKILKGQNQGLAMYSLARRTFTFTQKMFNLLRLAPSSPPYP